MRPTGSGALMLAAALVRVVTGGPVVYVDDSALPGGDGSSWTTAYRFLQDALGAAAAPGSGITEVRLAQGIYTADRNGAEPGGTGDRAASFQLINGVAVTGGYAGLGAPDPDARNVQLFPTILSGDLAGNDVVAGQCCTYFFPYGCTDAACREIVCTQYSAGCCSGYWTAWCSWVAWSLCGELCGGNSRAENTWHVVTGSGTDASAVLDGCTIRAGNANGPPPHDRGAGALDLAGAPTLIACTFMGNVAVRGSGIYNQNSHPVLINCLFQDNLTGDAFVGDNGAAMYNLDSDPELSGCTFAANFVNQWGSAIYNDGSSPALTGCLFSSNFALLGGGGLCNVNGSAAVLTDCTFEANWANAQSGGAITSDGSSHLTVTGCTFVDNFGVSTGGIASGWGNRTVVRECLFQGNHEGSTYGSAIGGGSLTIVDCQFIDNNTAAVNCESGSDSMQVSGCAFTGGVVGVNAEESTIQVSDCTFTGNEVAIQVQYEGNVLAKSCTMTDCENAVGALYGDVTLVDCLIRNSSDRAVTVDSATATLVNCSLIGNTKAVRFYSYGGSATLVNCELIGNGHAVFFIDPGQAAALYGCTLYANPGGVQFYFPAKDELVVRNSILWDSPITGSGVVDAAFSDIQGGWPGPGNIDADPMFLGGAEGFHLATGSPCIDAGHSWLMPADSLDLDGDGDTSELTPRDRGGDARFADDVAAPNSGCGAGAVIDMGAFEAPGGVPVAPMVYLDMNGDGVVDAADLLTLLGQWGVCQESCCLGDLDLDGDVDDIDLCFFLGGSCPADIDGDGLVGVTDMLALLAAWGTQPVGPPDLNCDQVVGIIDLLELFSHWGPCP